LWDKLTPQVQDTLNLMHASRINLTISAYEALNGSYDWNRYPLAPLGCKAVIYEDGNTRGSWASQGVDGWYLGPSRDHYQCNIYFGPETKAYHVSGSTELFPQHCQLPSMMPHQHLRALTDKLTSERHNCRSDSKRPPLAHTPPITYQQYLKPSRPSTSGTKGDCRGTKGEREHTI
jgi:hypothetical protein